MNYYNLFFWFLSFENMRWNLLLHQVFHFLLEAQRFQVCPTMSQICNV